MSSNFGLLDALIIFAYFVMLSCIGIYFSRRQRTLEDFFLAGRTMSWLPIGMSLMAALNSGIDYIMEPTKTIRYGLVFTVATLSWIILYPWVSRVMLPFYRRLNVISAYEYLEHRFNGNVRTLAALIFLMWRMGWMATAIYVPCLVISTVSGLPLLVLIIVLGSVVTIYTMLGGIKAVIWTDIIQFCIMLGGLGITVAVIVYNIPGGFAAIWRTADAGGRTTFVYHMPSLGNTGWLQSIRAYLLEPKFFVGILIATLVGRMTVYTADQVMVQRFQSTKSLRDSRQGFIINALGDAVWTFGLAFVGLGLFAFYQVHTLPQSVTPEQTFPHFMASVFPTGIIGLVIAAILASSLSSIDSAINSCTSVTVVDFYNRLITRGRDDSRQQIRVSRIVTCFFGILGMILAANVGRMENIVKIANTAIQTFTGPLLGLYLLGMFTRRARSGGVLIGGIIGTATAVYVAFFTEMFLWPTMFGLITTLIVGYLVSVIGALIWQERERAQAEPLTWRRVMMRPLPDETRADLRPSIVEPHQAAL